MSACHDCVFVFIYLSIYLFLITMVIYIFRTVYKFSDAQFFVTLSVRVLDLWDTELRTEDRTFKYVEICFLAPFFLLAFFFHSPWVTNYVTSQDNAFKFSGSILRQFDSCFVLVLFTLQITIKLRVKIWNLKILEFKRHFRF